MVGHRKNEELVVITKMYDLILWSCNHTSKFPRNHRFVSQAPADPASVEPRFGNYNNASQNRELAPNRLHAGGAPV